MTQSQLEQALKQFDQIATLVREDERRQIWRFDIQSKPYYLYFHVRRSGFKRMYRVNAALAGFVRLQSLQRAGIPSPRASAHLAGFRIRGRIGDALIVESIDGAQQLDRYLADHAVRCAPVPRRLELARQAVQIVNEIGKLKLGCDDLGLHRFLVAGDRLYFHGVDALRSGGLRLSDVFTLAHHAAPFASRAELLRGWRTLNPDAQGMPRRNPVSRSIWKAAERRTLRENKQFGILRSGNWSGHFTRSAPAIAPWSHASRLPIERKDWESAWPALLSQLQSGLLECIKSDSSGDIYSGQVILSGRPIAVMVKRPRRKFWYRYITDLVRQSRAKRTWIRAWQLLWRNLPCEWPMLLMERRVLGYVADAVVVFERVPGQSLDQVDLDSLTPRDRERLFHRAGRILRDIERAGLAHGDAKSTNWIVYKAPGCGPSPVMIDLYGIRPLTWFLQTWGIRRLLRAMKQHPQYTPADSLALCRGYAPYSSQIVPEPSGGQA